MSTSPSNAILVVISSDRGNSEAPTAAHWFATTHWSLVLAAGSEVSSEATAALERLCRVYWYPLYAFTRRRGVGPHDAEDLVQGFFERLIQKETLRKLQREGGRFRSFLLACYTNFLNDRRDFARGLKRGGGCTIISLDSEDDERRYLLEPAEPLDPEKLFERRWALTVLDTVLKRLRTELEAQGKGQLFDQLQGLIVGEAGSPRQVEIGERLGLSAGAVAVAVHRLRQRFRDLLREEIAQTVQRVEEVDEEMKHLLAALRGC